MDNEIWEYLNNTDMDQLKQRRVDKAIWEMRHRAPGDE